MKLSVTRWLLNSSLLALCLGISQFSLAAEELPLQAYTRDATSLNGEWKIIVDPYENGYYNYRYEPFDQQENPSVNAFFTDSKQKTPSDLIEYDFDKADTLRVPAIGTRKKKSSIITKAAFGIAKSSILLPRRNPTASLFISVQLTIVPMCT